MTEDPDRPRGVDMGPPPNLREMTAVALFAATLIAAAMLFTWAPVAISLVFDETSRSIPRATVLRFAAPYAALILGPVAGWLLWWRGVTFAAIAVLAVFGMAAWSLASATV